MSLARERFRRVISRPECTLAANIFDPLSARIAHMLDYEVCFLSGSVGKVANLGVPDIVMTNMTDLVDVCRRITRIADVSLMHDGEDGFGNAVNVVRSVKELEAAGVSAIEIEDAIPPLRFNQKNPSPTTATEENDTSSGIRTFGSFGDDSFAPAYFHIARVITVLLPAP